ncbi:Endonuclease/exonuclease/phosphatase family [Sesbania bispinosa]|nr:Endonuclease/exonuclease/phosphatase family [Sesbania bispinosa]
MCHIYQTRKAGRSTGQEGWKAGQTRMLEGEPTRRLEGRPTNLPAFLADRPFNFLSDQPSSLPSQPRPYNLLIG